MKCLEMCRKEFDVNKSERRGPDANHIQIQARCIRLDARGNLTRNISITQHGIGFDSSQETPPDWPIKGHISVNYQHVHEFKESDYILEEAFSVEDRVRRRDQSFSLE